MNKAVIFDLDGTLLNTLGDLTAAVNHALAAHGFLTRTEAQVRTYVGDGVRELIARACPPDTDPDTQASVLAAYLPYYAAHHADRTVPYDGVLDLLASLRAAGYRLAVVSNKHDAGVQALCARFFGEYLDVVVGADGSRPLKPAPDGILYALSRLGIAPEHAWYVGDSAVDVVTARAAGVRSVAVTWGFQDPERLLAERPMAVAHTIEEARKTLLGE
ncbi:MAG: HAD-IIIA family hydrolase [Clostridia bacterium]|nr:HAD-IIIA family hydrolase [Clostridia bacterium]